MRILLAMGDGGPAGKHGDAWDRGSKWLQETPVRRLKRSRSPIECSSPLDAGIRKAFKGVEQLRSKQQADGGWAKPQLATDALATGQALFALGAAGVGPDDPAVRQAWSFLASTQEENGSWVVHTQNPNSHDPVISYFGTGWGTLGLMRTLHNPLSRNSYIAISGIPANDGDHGGMSAVRVRHCAKTIVAFRSAKERSFAERKATIRRLVLAQNLTSEHPVTLWWIPSPNRAGRRAGSARRAKLDARLDVLLSSEFLADNQLQA